MIRRRRFWVRRCNMTLAVLCLAALLVSCSESTCPGTGDDDTTRPDRATPDDLLNFFANAYEEKDIDAYSLALHDYYQFEFTPEVVDSLGLPQNRPWWGKAEDLHSTQNMFEDPDVTDIEIHFEALGVESEWEGCSLRFISDGFAQLETTWINGLCASFEPDIKVHIEKPGEETLTLWVNYSFLDIMVTPDPDWPGDWVILRIKETHKPSISKRQELSQAQRAPVPASPGDPSTWGSIKVIFK